MPTHQTIQPILPTRGYDNLPLQARTDVDECIIAYDAGGKSLATRTFRAICEARNLTVAETVMLGGYARGRLASLGMLPIG